MHPDAQAVAGHPALSQTALSRRGNRTDNPRQAPGERPVVGTLDMAK